MLFYFISNEKTNNKKHLQIPRVARCDLASNDLATSAMEFETPNYLPSDTHSKEF